MNTTIVVHNRELAEDTHLEACLRLAGVRHQHVEHADVYVSPRTEGGWLEYGVNLKYETGGGMFLGVIQRTPNDNIEVHS